MLEHAIPLNRQKRLLDKVPERGRQTRVEALSNVVSSTVLSVPVQERSQEEVDMGANETAGRCRSDDKPELKIHSGDQTR